MIVLKGVKYAIENSKFVPQMLKAKIGVCTNNL